MKSIKNRADQLASLIERAGANAWFMTLYILILTFAITAPSAITQLKHELWTIVSANISDNLLSGSGLVSTIDPMIGSKPVSPLVWPGPVAIIWTTIWKGIGLSWLIEPALAFLCVLLIGFIIRKIDPPTSLLAVTICIFHPQLSSSTHYSPDLVLSLVLILSAILVLAANNISWKSAFAAAFLSLLGFWTNPIWLPLIVLMPLACNKRTSKFNQLLTLVGFIMAVVLLMSLKLSGALTPFLQLHQISNLPWRRIYSALIPLWQHFIASPLVLIYLLCLLHGFRERKETDHQRIILLSSIFSVVLLSLSPLSYYSVTYMDLHSFAMLLLFVSLPTMAWGFKRLIFALSLQNEKRMRLVQMLVFLIIVYVMGINAVQKRVAKVILSSDNAPALKQQRAALIAARNQLPPDEWLLVIDGWDLASGMSNIIIPNETARLNLGKEALPTAHDFSGVFFSETNEYAYDIPLASGGKTSSWDCTSIEGYRFCKRP